MSLCGYRMCQTWAGQLVRAAWVAFFTIVLAGPKQAQCDGGELNLALGSGHEAAHLHHPAVASSNTPGAWTYMPWLSLSATYGLSHRWRLGLSFETSLPHDVQMAVTHYDGDNTGTLRSDVLRLFVPLSAAWHLQRGDDWSMELIVAAGPTISHWRDVALYYKLPTEADAGTRIAVTPQSAWYNGWAVRLQALATWRPTAWFEAAAGPHVALAGRQDVSLGASVQARFLWGVGPYF